MLDATISSLLSSIWFSFERVGITNTFDIIEYLAALLTETQRSSASFEEVLPRMPPDRPGLQVNDIRRLLSEAAMVAGSQALLFDRYVVFRLRERLPDRGGHYPTPRHIVQFMRHLVQIEEQHHLADFACGTGGFLVSREPHEVRASTITGIDNSPEWARLAWANVVLHGYTDATILVGDPLRLLSRQSTLSERQFDRILMNPPFGAPIDAALAKEMLDYDTGGNSETALTTLALHALSEMGRVAVLVPTGLLFGKNIGEHGLRERLIGVLNQSGNIVSDYQLDAVITLPKDALQPYGNLPTHILLARRRTVDASLLAQHATWFFQIEKDGYPAGRRRDIILPPTKTPDTNDLPFVEMVLLAQKNATKLDYTFSIGEQPSIGIRQVMVGEAFLGVAIETVHENVFSLVAYFPKYEIKEGEQIAPFFLLETVNADDTQHLSVKVSVNSVDEPEQIDDIDEFLKQMYEEKGIPERDRPKRENILQTLHQEEEQVQAIAIAVDDRILGQATLVQRIIERDYELQPKEYIKTTGGKQPVEPSAVLLGRVRLAQTTFQEQVDGLLGRLELVPIANLQLLSNVRTEVRPFSRLSEKQEQLWQRICSTSEERLANLNGLFTLEDVRGEADTRENAQLTLDLFERMGVIVPVTIVDPNKREPLSTILYRRVTERDFWRDEES